MLKTMKMTAAAASALAMIAVVPATANAAEYVFDVGGVYSVDGFLDLDNEFDFVSLGESAYITGVSWDFTVETFSPSWGSEVSFALTDSFISTGVLFTPGIGDSFSGTFNYVGSADLIAEGLDFSLNEDGLLYIEFYEGYDDFIDAPDAYYQSGTITVTYEAMGAIPEASTWAMMILGLGFAGGALRRRKDYDLNISYA